MTEEFEYVRGIDPNGRSVNVPKSLFGGNLDVASEEVLGGVKASPKSETDTNEVKIDPNTGKLYCPPSEVSMATAEQIGGIVADVKTSEETEEVKIDPNTGKAYVRPSSKLGMATSETLGGVKANPATDNDTQEVHITEDGFLVTQPSTGGENEGVTGVKGNAETSYRKGNVNITPANIGLGNVNNTADSNKSVKYATSSGSATKATQDANGNVITETYATKTEVSNAESIANEAKTVANIAKNAVETLEGLANTTTAQETLAAQVVQIEENKQNVEYLSNSLSVLNGGTYHKNLTLDDIGVRRSGYYINMNDGKQYSASIAVITNAVFLNVGDSIHLYTGGSGFAVIAKSEDVPDNSTVFTVIAKADNLISPIDYEVMEAGYYSFSGRNAEQGDSALVLNINKQEETKGIVPGMEYKVTALYDGTLVEIEYSVEDLSGEGAMIDRYLNYDKMYTLGSTDTIVTAPVYLYAGDRVRCSTGGTGFCVFAESSTGIIVPSTTFKAMTDGSTSFDGYIEKDGWYVFSGRTNRTDGTNLDVYIKSSKREKNVYDLLNEKASKPEVAEIAAKSSGGNGFALSIGADSVKDNIPAYPWFETVENDGTTYGTYLDDKIDSVPQGDSFIFISDVHYKGNKKESAKLIDYVRRRLGIKTIIHGGDVLNESPTIAEAAKEWLDFNRDFVFRIGGDFKQVCGDHDHNGRYASTGQALSYQFIQRSMNGYNIKELAYDTMYDEQVKELATSNGWTEDEIKEYDAWKKMHYYFDDATINTRFIVLHTGWTGDVGLAADKLGSNVLNENNALYLQMDFLYNSLSSCPDGRNVVVVGHNVVTNVKYTISTSDGNISRYNVNEVSWIGAWQSVAKMIRAYKNKSAVVLDYRDWSGEGIKSKNFDFAWVGTPNVVFCMGGDVHWDILAKSSSSSEVLSVVSEATSLDNIIVAEGTITSSDILHALTMTDGADRGYRGIIAPPGDSYNDSNDSALTANPNTAGTLDSQVFDIVTITKNAVYFTRIGSGKDRVVYFYD
ncbi:MAG: metallophosphoesterase [Bacteroides sp.]|nr:metallophosphoesterase [Bacteroides sp.]